MPRPKSKKNGKHFKLEYASDLEEMADYSNLRAERRAVEARTKADRAKKGDVVSQQYLKDPMPDYTPDELAANRPPSWAKGRAIGLWHRAKQLKKKEGKDGGKKKSKKSDATGKITFRSLVHLELPNEKLLKIEEILNKIGIPAPPCVQSVLGQNIQDRYKHVEESAFKTKFLRCISGNIQDRISSTSRHCCLRKDPELDQKYLEEGKEKMTQSKCQKMMGFRQKLPSWGKRSEILSALEANSVILVTGETGCGKTTQVPQFILDDAIDRGEGSRTAIMVTQPRRISAITVAERVATERGERLGRSVGYQIRLEGVAPRSTGSITYCTTGILLQMMHSDPLLTRISTVIVDEIHERDTISDFVLTLLKDVIPLRPDLKVILMSATLNAELFSKYFDNCPTVHIPGFTYPVEEFYLEDILETIDFNFPQIKKGGGKVTKNKGKSGDEQFLEAFHRDIELSGKYSRRTIDNLKNPESNEINLDLIVRLIKHISSRMDHGAILVFLTGWDKISSLNRLLTQSNQFPRRRFRIIPLHSLMPTTNQREVFERPPPGVRKIILSTNIAETSITIDDVVYVINCGKIKVKNFDVDGNISTLKEEWVSLANARQRRGRAGRVKSGYCFHLYSKGREMLLQKDMLPEMLRTRLEEVILQAKMLQVGKIKPFLRKAMDPPSEKAVDLSLNLLVNMKALDDEENLTPLGYHLASLPIDPQAGKMLLFGALFSLLDPISSVTAALSFKDPFVIPMGQEREVDAVRKSFDAGHKSDHLILAKAIAQYEVARDDGSGSEFLNDKFMSANVVDQLLRMKTQLVSLLYHMKFAVNANVVSVENNVNSSNIALVRAVICAGLFPNIALVKKIKRNANGRVIPFVLTLDDDKKVDFHPKSIFSTNEIYHSKFVAYFEKLKSNGINLFDSTMVYPISLVFACQNLLVHDNGKNKILDIGNQIHLSCSKRLTTILVELRAWFDWLIEYQMCHPGVLKWSDSSYESIIFTAIAELLTSEEDLSAVKNNPQDIDAGSDDDDGSFVDGDDEQ